MTIAVVNAGLGNVASVINMISYLGYRVLDCRRPEQLEGASFIVLPGVGAYDAGVRLLQGAGFRDVINGMVREQKTPILGICLGMQLLLQGSEEGSCDGLGLIPGRVVRFATPGLRIPHMGWNYVERCQSSPLFRLFDAKKTPRFYFTHSYHVVCDEQYVAGRTVYGEAFPSIVQSGHVMGAQFHPEKSHQYGMRMFRSLFGGADV